MTTAPVVRTSQQRAVDHSFGRLTLTLAVVWAVTTVAAAVAAKASPEFFWVILILIVGASGSGACVETARRQAAAGLTIEE